MSTSTNAAAIVVTTAEPKVVASIASYVSALEKVEGGYNNIAKVTGNAAARLGLSTAQQVSDLLRFSYFEQAKLSDAPDADKAAYLDTVKSDISNLTSLILPRPIVDGKGKDAKVLKSTEELIEARDKAWAYNDSLPKGGRRNLRIGQKSVLDIVRGNEDVDYIIGVKNGTIAPKAKDTSAADTGSATAGTPTGQTDANGTPAEGSQNSPEAQAATVPPPQDGQPVISDARGLLRAALRNLKSVFVEQHSIPLDVVKEIFQDELSKF